MYAIQMFNFVHIYQFKADADLLESWIILPPSINLITNP